MWKLYWKPIHILIMVIAAALLLAFTALVYIPKSEGYVVTGTVVAKGTSASYGEGGDKLRVKLDHNVSVSIVMIKQVGIRVGDQVLLSAFDRYFIKPKYQFLSMVNK